MTSKEALERLLKIAYVEPGPTKEKFITYARETEHNKTCSALYNAIKQDLERLEKFAHENASLHTEIDSLQSENAKLKKVIEILTTKDIYIGVLNRSNNSSEYNNYMSIFFDYNFWNMPQEDFDLLKEVLE